MPTSNDSTRYDRSGAKGFAMKEELILKLFEKFEQSSSVYMRIKDGENEFVLKKEGAFAPDRIMPIVQSAPPLPVQASAAPTAAGSAVPSASAVAAAAGTGGSASGAQAADSAAKNLIQIKSPIVGTFYRSPSPDSPPYVDKGTKVKKGQPLCVLEAMKMMNTLESEFDGVIEDIAVSNGDLVEFDQVLFTLRTV